MKPVMKKISMSFLCLFLVFLFFIFAKKVLAVEGICSQITIRCIRNGSFENVTVYNNGNWYGEGSDKRVVYVDPNNEFDVVIYAASGYTPYVYTLSIPGEVPIKRTGFAYHSLFNPPMEAVGEYSAQVDGDASKIFRIELEISDTRNSSSSERSIFASVPLDSAITGEKYIYAPVLAESIVGGGSIIWYLSKSPEGMELDDKNGKLMWLPTDQQVGYHETTLLAAVDDGDKILTEEQSWEIAVRERPANKDADGGICFISRINP